MMQNMGHFIKGYIGIIVVAVIILVVVIIEATGIKEDGLYYVDLNGKVVNKYSASDSIYSCCQFNEDGTVFINGSGHYRRSFMDSNGNFFDDKQIWWSKSGNGKELSGIVRAPIIIKESDELFILDDRLNRIGKLGVSSADKIDFSPYFTNGFGTVWINDLAGYINSKGEWVIKPQYLHVYEFGENGIAWVMDSETELWGCINTKGEWVTHPQYSDVCTPSKEGYARVKTPGTELWGYADGNGKQITDMCFDDGREFCGGFALVCQDGKGAYINNKGELVTDFVYDYSDSQKGFSEGYAYVKKYGEEKYGYINECGEMAISAQYSEADKFSCGLALVYEEDGGAKYINESGKTVLDLENIAFSFSNANTFSEEGYAVVNGHNGKFGIINTEGKWVFKPQFVSERGIDISNPPEIVNGHFIVYLKKGQHVKRTFAK